MVFPGGAAVKIPPANARDSRDWDSICGSGRSPGGGHGNPPQYSCLENPHGQRSLAGHSPWSPRVRYDLATEQMLSLLKLWVMMAKSRGDFPSQFMVLRIRIRWRAFSYLKLLKRAR